MKFKKLSLIFNINAIKIPQNKPINVLNKIEIFIWISAYLIISSQKIEKKPIKV